jgi:predicted aspartyl protease
MESAAVEKVVVSAKIENLKDLYEAESGARSPDQVRSATVTDALVDTGATMLSLPKRLIEQLGMKKLRTRTARTAAGPVEFGLYSTVQLTIQDRECRLDVCEVPDDCPMLIGQVPLENLDFVVDPVGQRLIGNPEHGGKGSGRF